MCHVHSHDTLQGYRDGHEKCLRDNKSPHHFHLWDYLSQESSLWCVGLNLYNHKKTIIFITIYSKVVA